MVFEKRSGVQCIFLPLPLPCKTGSSIGYFKAIKAVYKESMSDNALLAEHSFFFVGSVSWLDDDVIIPVTGISNYFINLFLLRVYVYFMSSLDFDDTNITHFICILLLLFFLILFYFMSLLCILIKRAVYYH